MKYLQNVGQCVFARSEYLGTCVKHTDGDAHWGWGDRDGGVRGVCVSECTGKFEYLLLDCDFLMFKVYDGHNFWRSVKNIELHDWVRELVYG